MSSGRRDENTGVILLAGLGAGLLAGLALAMLRARRKNSQQPLYQSVEDLRAHADRILDELSESIDSLVARSREAETNNAA